MWNVSKQLNIMQIKFPHSGIHSHNRTHRNFSIKSRVFLYFMFKWWMEAIDKCAACRKMILMWEIYSILFFFSFSFHSLDCSFGWFIDEKKRGKTLLQWNFVVFFVMHIVTIFFSILFLAWNLFIFFQADLWTLFSPPFHFSF